MITACSPDIDNATLESRINSEMRQPDHMAATPMTPLDLSDVNLPPEDISAVLSLKIRLRAIPVIGPVMGLLNSWQRQTLHWLRAAPFLGHGIGWLKSLALMQATREA
ncbi:MAG: hypothetical protein ABL951_16775, partial [Alphaproteobacteria bacterium]